MTNGDDDSAVGEPQSAVEASRADDDTPVATDGGGTQHPTPGDAPLPDRSQETDTGAPDDEEMPLTEHIEEMIKRLGVVVVIMGVVSLVTLPLADEVINWLWYSFLPGSPEMCVDGGQGTACPRVYHPLGLIFTRLKVASLAGFVLALPVFVYETYRFMRPGLYPHERRYYLAAVPTSLVLAFVGLTVAYFGILPFIFEYFLNYSEGAAQVAFGLSETFNLILMMLGIFAAIFQIPLFMMLAIMMGVTTRQWLAAKRLYFWFGFGTVAFVFGPDPTGMAPFLIAITMIILYEATLLLLKWTGR